MPDFYYWFLPFQFSLELCRLEFVIILHIIPRIRLVKALVAYREIRNNVSMNTLFQPQPVQARRVADHATAYLPFSSGLHPIKNFAAPSLDSSESGLIRNRRIDWCGNGSSGQRISRIMRMESLISSTLTHARAWTSPEISTGTFTVMRS